MCKVPFNLRYSLSRFQRLIPHLSVWGPFSIIIPGAFAGVVLLAVSESASWAVLLVPLLFLFSGFFIGLLQVVIYPSQVMDIIVEKDALGVLAGGERWYLFLDGIISITKYRQDTWTIYHYNGAVINVLASEISDDEIGYIKSVAERGRTSEGIQAVIERGRMIQQIESGILDDDPEG